MFNCAGEPHLQPPGAAFRNESDPPDSAAAGATKGHGAVPASGICSPTIDHLSTVVHPFLALFSPFGLEHRAGLDGVRMDGLLECESVWT